MEIEEQLLEELKKQYRNIAEKPLVVSILGQTGVGKSTLINALFNTDLETNPIEPCTKEIKTIQALNQNGFQLWFNDMPGLGENNESDKIYLNKYNVQKMNCCNTQCNNIKKIKIFKIKLYKK